jgi:hypothetical protein
MKNQGKNGGTCIGDFSNLTRTLFICSVGIILPITNAAQEIESKINKPIKIQRVKSSVVLDGLSNEPAWEGIESFPMLMRTPNFGNEPSESTEVLLVYDDDYLYVAGRLYDREPSKIQSTSLKRDGGWNWSTDHLGVIFDTFNDNENAVLFVTTPTGTRTDYSIKNDGEGTSDRYANPSWNTFWDVATEYNDDGWFTEMRIPFSSLRFEVKGGQTVMGFIAYRLIPRKFELSCFPFIPEKKNLVAPSQGQEIIFEGITRHNPVYITPYLLGGLGQSNELNEDETAYEGHEQFAHEAGLDIKYGLTNNLTLDVTINPDFAQVEADDQMINLTRYSLFFPEKRLFFQERQGNFEFRFEDDDRLFYSRRIGLHEGNQVRIYGGARVVGRAGRWDIGFLNLQTEKFEDLLSENFNVAQLRRQIINPYSYIGGMVTSRIGNRNNWNTTYGIDGIFRLFKDEYLILKWAQTYEDGTKNQIASLVPSKIYINWNRRSNKGLGYNLSYSRSGANFNPGIGYERRDNYTRFGDMVQYKWFPSETSRLQNHYAFIEGFTFFSNDNWEFESSQIGIGWLFETKTNSTGSVTIKQFKEDVIELFSISDDADVPIGKYTFWGIGLTYNLLRGSPYTVGTTIDAGSFYDGWRFSMSITPVANISAHFQLEGMYQINRVEFPDRNQQFTGHIGRLKISAFLNSRLSLVSLVQYNSAIDKIIANVRFRYNPREGHDLYIVYDEGLNSSRDREIPELPLSSIRTIMLKYSYTFVIGG